jgi:transcriptional regulator with XRE-family HTH domain
MGKIPESFIHWLRKELEQNNLSQSEASRRAGLNQNAISDLIHGKVDEISLKTCRGLSRVFNVSLEEVLRQAGHVPRDDAPILSELVEIARELEPKDQSELLNYARWRLAGGNSKS